MKTILYITSSVRSFKEEETQHQSITRLLGERFLEQFRLRYHDVEIIHRNLSIDPPSFLTQEFIAAAFEKAELTSEQKAVLKMSDQYIEEIKQANIIVIASPMYNYGMPAVLKAWFDQVIRVNKTFSFDLARGDEPLEPILSGKSLVLLASWGEFNFRKGENKYHLNHLSSHIEQLAPYLGAEQFFEIASEYQEFSDDRHRASKLSALTQVKELANNLASI